MTRYEFRKSRGARRCFHGSAQSTGGLQGTVPVALCRSKAAHPARLKRQRQIRGRHGDIEDSSSFDDLRLPRRDQPSSPHDVIEGWVPFLRLPGIHAGDTHEQGSGNVQKPHPLRGCRRIPPTGPTSCAAITRWRADALAATGLASGRSLRPWPATRRLHTAGLRYPIHGR